MKTQEGQTPEGSEAAGRIGEEPGEPVRERVEFPCRNCGAGMLWDPARDALSCEYCGSTMAVPREEGTVLERPLEEAGSAARGLGIEVRVARCDECGARVAFEGSSTSELCVYCGSASVLSQSANRNAIRPESLVPLDLSREDVEKAFRAWVKRLWFRPKELRKKRFDAAGIYVPYWTFDCRVRSAWSADSGHYYYVMEPRVVMVRGKPRMRMQRVRKIRWVPSFGEREDAYDDLLVHASKGQPAKLVGRLGGFDTRALVPYRPEYLAGWRAEEYQVDLEEGWERGSSEVASRQRALCAADVPGDTYRNLRVKNRIDGVRWKHVLLPVWSLQYRHGKKTYTVLLNGQTGAVAGEAPIDWGKIGLAVLGVLALVGILALAAALAS